MRLFPGRPASISLLVLVLIFVLLIGLIVVFSQQILSNLTRMDSLGNSLALLAAVFLPLSLFAVIAFQLIHLWRERAARKPGTLLKTRLLVFFALVVLLSSIPQALLSVNFINSTINFWLKAGIGEALQGGLSISLDYYHKMVENLNRFGKSPLLSSLLRDLERNPQRVWKNITEANSLINLFQVFDAQGREVFFGGQVEARLQDVTPLRDSMGNLPKEDREKLSILRNISRHSIAGRSYFVIVGTVLTEGFNDQATSLTESLETFNQLARYKRLFRLVLTGFYFFFSLPIFLLSILISLLLTEEIIQPIVQLEEATRRVAEGDFSVRILTRSEDELSALVGSFNRMTAELSASRQKLLKAEKISAWQEIAQRLAHEIKNPLTPIKLSAQRILKKAQSNPQECQKILEPAVSAIIREVENLDRLLVEFREFARLPGPRPERFNLRDLVEEVAAVYRNLSAKVRFDCNRLQNVTLLADRNQMKQVFANLFKNAVQAMPDGGDILVRSDIVKKDDCQYCRIWIKDTGIGISAAIRELVFNPYFTTKKEGTGLGLAIVERVVFDHKGVIWFETQVGSGTTFIIDLPLER